MLEHIHQFYGIDWIAMALTILAIWQLGNKSKMGFVYMMIGNAGWVAMGAMTQSLAMVLANSIFFFMNGQALWKWIKRPPADS